MPTTAELVGKHGTPNGAGLEVGVGLGDSCAMMLEVLKPAKMALVDCYERQPWDVYPDDYNVDQKAQDVRMVEALKRLREHAGRTGTEIVFHRMKSLEFAASHADDVYDFIFLDANHSFKAAEADIAALWPLVRSGGAMFCHDYCRVLAYYGVIEAVDQFVAAHPEAKLVEVSEEKFPIVVLLKG